MRRASREINRLREVLRTTMDQFLDAKEEVKDLQNKVNRYEVEIYELHVANGLVQQGKLSSSDLKAPVVGKWKFR